MPAMRNIPSRRSRRLSKQQPRKYDDEEWESLELAYPSPDPAALSDARAPESDSSFIQKPFIPQTSHTRKRKEGHIPRPPNAFMLFRSDLWLKQKDVIDERDHRNISRIAGQCWKNLVDGDREKYRKRAEFQKQLHALKYPDYKYAPVYRKERPLKRKSRSSVAAVEEKCNRVASLVMHGVEGADLQVAMQAMVKEEEAEHAIPPSSPSPPPKRIRTSKRTVAPPAGLELSHTPELCTDRSASPDGGFVPTSEIPPLDLYAVKKADTQKFDYALRPTSMLPFNAIGSYYPVNPMLSEYNDIQNTAFETSFPYFSPYGSELCPMNPAVEFTNANPFSECCDAVNVFASWKPCDDTPVSPSTIPDSVAYTPAIADDDILADWIHFNPLAGPFE